MPDRLLRCVTVRNPWAEAIARRVKPIENRTRATKYRGPVGIHAGLRDDRLAWRNPLIVEALDDLIRYDPELDAMVFGPRGDDGCTYGAILAVADLVDCHLDTGCCRPWGMPDQWHLVLSDVRRLDDPVPARGALQVPWTADESTSRLVWDQLAVAVA